MDPEEREYLLYLSLYDGVTSLAIGVDSLSTLDQPTVDLPVRERPVVFMGPVFCRVVVLPVLEWPIQIFWNVGSIVNVSI